MFNGTPAATRRSAGTLPAANAAQTISLWANPSATSGRQTMVALTNPAARLTACQRHSRRQLTAWLGVDRAGDRDAPTSGELAPRRVHLATATANQP